MKLVDGKMVIIENPRVSLELAQKISEDAVEIRGDLAYNSRGGVVAVYERGNWTTPPFTNEELEAEKMIKMQAIRRGLNFYSQSWKVETFIVYGEPGKGAVKIFGQDGELVAYVAAEVRAWNVVDKQQQVANIPVIYYDKTGKQIVVIHNTFDNGYYNESLEYYVDFWIPLSYYFGQGIIDGYSDPRESSTTKKARLSKGDEIRADFFIPYTNTGISSMKEIQEILGDLAGEVHGVNLIDFFNSGKVSDLSSTSTTNEVPRIFPNGTYYTLNVED